MLSCSTHKAENHHDALVQHIPELSQCSRVAHDWQRSITMLLYSTYLAEIHDDALVHFLPQMRSEDLDERDLECRDLAVHENARQVELHLKTNVHLEVHNNHK